MRVLLFLLIFGIMFSCRKECEKVTDSTLLNFFGNINTCSIFENDTVIENAHLKNQTIGQPGTQQSACFRSYTLNLASTLYGKMVINQNKNHEYHLTKNSVSSQGIILHKEDSTFLIFNGITFVQKGNTKKYFYIVGLDTFQFTKPCPN